MTASADRASVERSPVPVRPASTILLVRDEPRFEVLMVTRHHQVDFVGGAMVFPGGKLDGQDGDPAWAETCFGWDLVPENERASRIGALREAFEESAILLARNAEDGGWEVTPAVADAREDVARGRLLFRDLLVRHGLKLDLAGLVPFARWVTPDFMPKRFDTLFYLASAPASQLAASDGWETVDAEWIAPGEALRLAAAGERTVVFPTRMNLRRLAESGTVADAIGAARARPLVPVEPRRERRGDEVVLVLAPEHGYGDVAEPMLLPR